MSKIQAMIVLVFVVLIVAAGAIKRRDGTGDLQSYSPASQAAVAKREAIRNMTPLCMPGMECADPASRENKK